MRRRMWRKRLDQMQAYLQLAAEEDAQILAAIAQLEAEEEEHGPRRGGSVFGRRVIFRDRHNGYLRLMQDYFATNPAYNRETFRRRFRMTPEMFNDICAALAAFSSYFRFGRNAAGEASFHTNQKVTAAVRTLAYGGQANVLDEYVRMGESTLLECVSKFTECVCEIYGPEYLRQPNEHDVARLLAEAEERGFPGMLGSIDCMHWEWERSPAGVQGRFKKSTIVLEAVTSYDLWVWHAFFGTPGLRNDVNADALRRSPMLDNLAAGSGPKVGYTVNGREYDMGYYLADGIYPPWAALIGPVPAAQSDKHKKFNEKHREFRKVVERGCGVMQAQYGILRGPTRMWHPHELKCIVDCCVILHNMAIKYERGMEQLGIEDYEGASRVELDSTNRNVPEIQQLIAGHRRIQSRAANEQLKLDLVEHVWSRYGND